MVDYHHCFDLRLGWVDGEEGQERTCLTRPVQALQCGGLWNRWTWWEWGPETTCQLWNAAEQSMLILNSCGVRAGINGSVERV